MLPQLFRNAGMSDCLITEASSKLTYWTVAIFLAICLWLHRCPLNEVIVGVNVDVSLRQSSIRSLSKVSFACLAIQRTLRQDESSLRV